MQYTEIESQKKLQTLLEKELHISKYAFQNLDFTSFTSALSDTTFTDCIFLGCSLPDYLVCNLYTNNYLFPKLDMPYNTYVNGLYTKEILYDNYILNQPESYKKTKDAIIYSHFLKTGKEGNDIKETLGRRLHDHSISDALYGFLENYPEDKKVAIMGGHGLSRADEGFTTVAQLSKKLTEKGYLMLSGGGPGAMEATHVGAWFAGKTDAELEDAIAILATAPSYKDRMWLDKSFEVLKKYPTSNYESIGIPTWLYGHEPPTPFATRIAKYFANSIREDGLLAIAKGGIVFTPGSAGTIQEIFQDATQNHYLSFEVSSPMIFMDSEYWTKERPVYPLIEKLNNEEKYSNLLLSLCDTNEEVIEQLDAFSISK
ncbi:LOG family protein [Aquimarina agarivorans]|uniref:LOG family protein n=1 Tax=Aquimarina agarivorans TaxID=980584 RepID=UPI000304BE1B|nr:LOG family protein [Aquimarina agarivorans]